MKVDWSERFTLVTILAITALSFLLWLSGLFLLWIFLRIAGTQVDFWAMTEALSTAVAAAAVLGGGFVAYRELSELASSRHMEVADRLFKELNSAENIEARRWIFKNLSKEPEQGIQGLSPEGQAYIKQVLNSLDRVAFLTQTNWIPEKMIMPWMNPMVVKAWMKLEPYVDYESRRRNEPDYYRNIRRLGKHCLDWRAKNLPEARITWIDNAL